MLLLGADVVEALLDHAKDASPREACGVLAGRDEEGGLRVTTAYPVHNAHPEPEYNYTLDPEEHLEVMHRVDEGGLDLVGYYHSHPAGPEGPSTIDAARSPWPGVVYLIISLRGEGSLTAWEWDAEARQFRSRGVRFE